MQVRESNEVTKRDAILRAAWKLIRHYGYTKTTIQDIAREAGIGKGTVYLSFSSKSEIMLGIVEATNERITNDLADISRKNTPPAHRLRECLTHRVMTIYDLVQRYPHGEEVISSMKPEIVRKIDVYVKKQGAILGRIIREGAAQGTFDVTDPDDKGLLLAGLFEHFTPPYYRFRSRKSLEQFVGSVTDLIIAGMRSGRVPGDDGLAGISAAGDPARQRNESGGNR